MIYNVYTHCGSHVCCLGPPWNCILLVQASANFASVYYKCSVCDTSLQKDDIECPTCKEPVEYTIKNIRKSLTLSKDETEEISKDISKSEATDKTNITAGESPIHKLMESIDKSKEQKYGDCQSIRAKENLACKTGAMPQREEYICKSDIAPNDISIDNCIVDGALANVAVIEGRKICDKCGYKEIIRDGLCEDCLALPQSWECSYRLCKKRNDGEDVFCRCCGIAKGYDGADGSNVARCVGGRMDKVWICPKCDRINEKHSNAVCYWCDAVRHSVDAAEPASAVCDDKISNKGVSVDKSTEAIDSREEWKCGHCQSINPKHNVKYKTCVKPPRDISKPEAIDDVKITDGEVPQNKSTEIIDKSKKQKSENRQLISAKENLTHKTCVKPPREGWVCKRCTAHNDISTESCIGCGVFAKVAAIDRRQFCDKCGHKDIIRDSLCEDCLALPRSWECSYRLCKRRNYGGDVYCRYCGIAKEHNRAECVDIARYFDGRIVTVWICDKCDNINKDCSNIICDRCGAERHSVDDAKSVSAVCDDKVSNSEVSVAKSIETIDSREEWKCRHCQSINRKHNVKCKTCTEPRRKGWACRMCTAHNDIWIESCVACGTLSNETEIDGRKNCGKCGHKEIFCDSLFCEDCLALPRSWECFYRLCKRRNCGGDEYCRFCGIAKGRNGAGGSDVARCVGGRMDKVWICDKCDNINEKQSSAVCDRCGTARYFVRNFGPNVNSAKINDDKLGLMDYVMVASEGDAEEGMSTTWQCRQCECTNSGDYMTCVACSVVRTPMWTCIICTLENEMANMQCSSCQYRRKFCERCGTNEIIGGVLCKDCVALPPMWRCWYNLCNKYNEGDDKYCGHCRLERFPTTLKGAPIWQRNGTIIVQKWICCECHNINNKHSSECSNYRCRTPRVMDYKWCRQCGHGNPRGWGSIKCQNCKHRL